MWRGVWVAISPNGQNHNIKYPFRPLFSYGQKFYPRIFLSHVDEQLHRSICYARRSLLHRWNFIPQNIYDWIWENPLYAIFFSENRVWCMVDKLYHRANSHSSPRPITRFAEELQRFVCNRTTPPIIKKLRSKGVAMHAYGVSIYYMYTRSQLNGSGWSHLKWAQRSSKSRTSPSIFRATASSMPKKLKRLANVQ